MSAINRFIALMMLISMSVFAQYGTYTVPAGSPMANGEHPRLFFTAGSFPEIATYITTYESADFQTWVDERDGEYSESPSSKDRRFLIWEACNFAFMYYAVKSGLLDSYGFNYTADQYASKAYDHAVEINNRVRNQGMREFRGGISGSNGGYITMTTAIIYDWMHDYLDLSQKQFLADLSIFLYNAESNDRCFPGEGMNIGNDFNSQCWEVGFWGGAAIWGDDLGASYTADQERLKDVIGWFLFDQVFDVQEVVHEGTAGNGEGGNYYGVTITQQYFQAIGLGSALNMDFAQEYGSMRDASWYYWNTGQPQRWDDGNTAGWIKHRFDDVWISGWSGLGFQTNLAPGLHLLKKSDPERAGAIRWLMEEGRGGIGNDNPVNNVFNPDIFWLWYKFLWGYKDIPKLSPDQYELPEANRFAMGETIIQSDLTTQDATKILFYTHQYFVNLHNHDDYGAFEVFKNGLLTINTGSNWKSTRALDIDPAETQNPSAPVFHSIMAIYTGSNNTYGHTANTTADADTPDAPANQPGGVNNIGTVEASESLADVYDYYDYDYTPTRRGNGYAENLNRRMLYIRDPNAPDYSNAEEFLLLYDDVDLNTNHTRRWLTRTVYQPEVVDGSWTTQSSDHLTSSGSTTLEITNTYGNNNGRMFLKVLSPDNFTFRLRGSPSSPFPDANGSSLGAGGNNSEDARNFVGTYRLEIEDDANSNNSEYLVVMQIGSATHLNTMASMSRLDAPEFLGAFINGNRVAFFNKDDNRDNNLSYTISASGSVRHYITGLEQGAYFVRQDGNSISGINTVVDEDGVLYFENNGGGSFVISKSNDVTAPSTPVNLRVSR